MHEGFKPGHLRRHRAACGGEGNREAMAGNDEFEHRRGGARAGGHKQQRHGRDKRDGVEMSDSSNVAAPCLSWHL